MNRKIFGFCRAALRRIPFGIKLANVLELYFFGIYRNQRIPSQAGIFYQLNSESGLIDIEERDNEGKFEYDDMIVANQIIGNTWLTSNVKKVVNIGSGVGTFEFQNAPKHPDIQFLASEMDETSTEWAINNRPFPNVNYCKYDIDTIIKQCLPKDKYDLAISVDVIEHVKDYKSFLDGFSQLADRAVISTPNRDRLSGQIDRPRYYAHVQEFDAGELFFILKMYYSKVELYSAPDILKAKLVPVGLYSSYDKLFAYCEK